MKRTFSILCLAVFLLLSGCRGVPSDAPQKEIKSVEILGETYSTVYIYRVTDLKVLAKTADTVFLTNYATGVDEAVYDTSPLNDDGYIVSDRLLEKGDLVSDRHFRLQRKSDGQKDDFYVSAAVMGLSEEYHVEKTDCGETYRITYYSCEAFAIPCTIFSAPTDARQALNKTVVETVKQNVLIYYEP